MHAGRTARLNVGPTDGARAAQAHPKVGAKQVAPDVARARNKRATKQPVAMPAYALTGGKAPGQASGTWHEERFNLAAAGYRAANFHRLEQWS